jgi:2-hydroxychromene-2-carboxylate isomerase
MLVFDASDHFEVVFVDDMTAAEAKSFVTEAAKAGIDTADIIVAKDAADLERKMQKFIARMNKLYPERTNELTIEA